MTRIVVLPEAWDQLDDLIDVLSLPATTKPRLIKRLTQLVTAPNSGRDLSAPYTPVQWILGPWGWMIIVFEHHPDTDVVYVLAIEDGRSSTAVTGIS